MESAEERLIPKIGSVQMCFSVFMSTLIKDWHHDALETAEKLIANKETFALVMMPGKTWCIPVRDNTAYLALDQFELATSPFINPGAGSRIRIFLGQGGKLMAVSRDVAYAFIRQAEANRIAAEAAIFLENQSRPQKRLVA